MAGAKRVTKIGLISVLLLGLSGCFGESKKGGLVVVNVLDKELYDDCHIAGSINIPLDELDQRMDTIVREADVVVYCSNYQCTGSEYAATKFLNKGFKNVSVYEGGMAEWFQAGLPVEGDHLKEYLHKPFLKIVNQERSLIPIVTMDELAKKMKARHVNLAA